jgi:hypothetical protein
MVDWTILSPTFLTATMTGYMTATPEEWLAARLELLEPERVNGVC